MDVPHFVRPTERRTRFRESEFFRVAGSMETRLPLFRD
jgi:hypothetical protein